jgi:hypothetical protein
MRKSSVIVLGVAGALAVAALVPVLGARRRAGTEPGACGRTHPAAHRRNGWRTAGRRLDRHGAAGWNVGGAALGSSAGRDAAIHTSGRVLRDVARHDSHRLARVPRHGGGAWMGAHRACEEDVRDVASGLAQSRQAGLRSRGAVLVIRPYRIGHFPLPDRQRKGCLKRRLKPGFETSAEALRRKRERPEGRKADTTSWPGAGGTS